MKFKAAVFKENALYPQGFVESGALELDKERVPVTYGYVHDHSIGWASNLERDGDVVMMEIEITNPAWALIMEIHKASFSFSVSGPVELDTPNTLANDAIKGIKVQDVAILPFAPRFPRSFKS